MRLLIADDNPDDRYLAIREMRKYFGDVEVVEILSEDDLKRALEDFDFDVVVTDYRLRWGTGFDVLNAVRRISPHIPVIMLTHTGDETTAVEAMKAGFDDYVLKSPKHIIKLPVAVEVAIEKKKKEREASEYLSKLQEYERFFKNAKDLFFILDTKGRFIEVNPKFAEMLGYELKEVMGSNSRKLVHPEDLDRLREFFRSVLRGETKRDEFRFVTKDGRTLWLEILEWAVFENGRLVRVEGVIRDITERKQMEDRLKESEERYRSVFENVVAGVYRTTPDGKIILANPYIAKLLGYESIEELKDRDLNKVEFFCPGYEREKFIRELEEKGYYLGESCWIRKDGSRVWILENTVAIRDENRRTKYYDGVVVDITKLKESEEMFRVLTEKSLVGVYLIQDGVFKYVNPKMAEFWGYSVEELIGKSPLEFIHPEDRDLVKRNIERRVRGEIDAVNYKIRVVRKDGEIRLNEVFGARIIYRGRPAVIGTLIDITEREELTRKLRESERKYRELWDNANDNFFIITPDGVFLDANQATLSTLGVSAEDIGKIKVQDVVDEDFVELVNRRIKRILETKEPLEPIEMRVKRRDGRKLWMELRSRPIIENGRVVAIHGIARDITKRKEYEEEIKRLNRLLRIVNEINNLLVREKDEDGLIRAIGENLSKFYTLVFVGIAKNGELKFYPSLDKPACVEVALSRREVLKLSPNKHVAGCRYLSILGHLFALVIPMIYDEKIMGIITIHSDRPFTDDEVEILTTLARDIAFAMNALRLEEEKFLAYTQIESNIEQFAILVDHIRNPLAALSLIAEIEIKDENVKEKILSQLRRVEEVLKRLDEGWLESEKVREFLRKTWEKS